MPSVATLLSGGISIGIFAGVFSGICYILIYGIRWAGKLRASLQIQEERSTNQNEKSCARCGRQLSLLAVGRGRRLQCARCKLNVCRYCCNRTATNKWLCSPCKKHRDVKLQSGEWFYQQLRQHFRSTVAALSSTDKNDEEVREFMEKLVETLVDGKLDNVPLNPLSSHEAYVKFFTLYHEILVDTLTRLSFSLKMAVADKSLPEGEPPSVIHMELKELMTQIIQKVMELPSFKKDYGVGNRDGSATDLESKSYEDILATAILNKIISRYQQQLQKQTRQQETTGFDRNSNVLRKRHMNTLTSEKMERLQSNEVESEGSTGSVSNSCDEYNSWSESSHHDPMSLTIEECIEEVTTHYNSDDETAVPSSEIDRFLSNMKFMKRQRVPFPEFGMDIIDGKDVSSDSDAGGDDEDDEEDALNVTVGVEVVNPIDSWEENWLFQRRKLKTAVGTCQPVPVPMLVPHPVQDYRALIGDVDADETTDLSECSDSVLEDLIDGSDTHSDMKQTSEYEEDGKDQEMLDKQRDLFLEYIREDLRRSSIETINKLNGINIQDTRGISPDTGQELNEKISEKSVNNHKVSQEVTKINNVPNHKDVIVHEVPNNTVILNEDNFSIDNSLNEAKNLEIPIVQVDSGEGSLEMQQDSEYTVHYATVAQLESGSRSASPAPIPKPRSINADKNSEFTEKQSVIEPEMINGFERPPLPGSIAEREHKKWQQAPPLQNNPYSKENIERRQRNRMYLSRRSSSEASIEFPEIAASKEQSLVEIDGKAPSKDFTQYVRDYYVNVKPEKEEENKRDAKLPKEKSKPVTVSSPEKITEECRQQVSVRVEVEVARWPCNTAATEPKAKPSVQTQTTNQESAPVWSEPAVVMEDDIALPSVKELAKQFSMLEEIEKVPRPLSPLVEKAKQHDMKVHSPIRQVHSLTARSISREFRDGLRGGTTAASKLGVNDKDIDNSGQISDDSGTASPTPASMTRHKLHDNIVFWEKKQSNNR